VSTGGDESERELARPGNLLVVLDLARHSLYGDTPTHITVGFILVDLEGDDRFEECLRQLGARCRPEDDGLAVNGIIDWKDYGKGVDADPQAANVGALEKGTAHSGIQCPEDDTAFVSADHQQQPGGGTSFVVGVEGLKSDTVRSFNTLPFKQGSAVS
jgi:hypothetical protein